MNDNQELEELQTAIRLTEAIIRYCQTPEFIELHMKALEGYKERYKKLLEKMKK